MLTSVDEWESVPPLLRPPLRLYGTATVKEIGMAIAGQLRLRLPPSVSDSTWVILAELRAPLAEALGEEIVVGARSRRMARGSVDDVSMADLVNACHDLRWGNACLPPRVEVDFLQLALRDLYADKLAPLIDKMLSRWDDAGYFDLRPAG